MDPLPPTHFLSLPRPDGNDRPLVDVPDTTTLAAHDYDVDTRTGFMPPEPPLGRLPAKWEAWEAMLDSAFSPIRLRHIDSPELNEADRTNSERWRACVRELPILPTTELKNSEILLRRAHHVLAWLLHLYVHTTPRTAIDVRIPPPITVPLLQVSSQLQLPPVLTYSDDVLYNWTYKNPVPTSGFTSAPALDNLRSLTLFTGTRDEEEFYLTSARIELRGVEALALMRAMMDEAFVGDTIALQRITNYLHTLAGVITDLTRILETLRDGVDPQVFYYTIRPWFSGVDSDPQKRKWVFEGIELDPSLKEPVEASGPSAGQSSLVHALDIFLGVDRYSHTNFPTRPTRREPTKAAPAPAPAPPTSNLGAAPATPAVPFLIRMQSYMPRHHRAFLQHLSANPRPLRTLVEETADAQLQAAYNGAVTALKVFRDAHVRIVALYILSPSKGRAGAGAGDGAPKGTGGTDAFKFVQGVRDQTAGALLSISADAKGS